MPLRLLFYKGAGEIILGKNMPKQPTNNIDVKIEKELVNKYNENYEHTLNNIFALGVFAVKNYRRSGYQIKLLEQILTELKKMNKGKV